MSDLQVGDRIQFMMHGDPTPKIGTVYRIHDEAFHVWSACGGGYSFWKTDEGALGNIGYWGKGNSYSWQRLTILDEMVIPNE